MGVTIMLLHISLTSLSTLNFYRAGYNGLTVFALKVHNYLIQRF